MSKEVETAATRNSCILFLLFLFFIAFFSLLFNVHEYESAEAMRFNVLYSICGCLWVSRGI